MDVPFHYINVNAVNNAILLDNDVLHVEWQLLGSEPTPWGATPRVDTHAIYMEERLLTMMWKILQIPKKVFHFHFAGADPVQHPVLITLLRYLSATPREVYVTIDANGERELSSYIEVARTFPRDHFRMHLLIYAGISDIRRVLPLIGALHDNGYVPHIRVVEIDPGRDGIWLKALCALRGMLPFNAEFENEDWKASFVAAASSGKKAIAKEFPL